jgi:hypothetical protein
VHAAAWNAESFNPGQGGGGRFHFILGKGGSKVPSLYAATSRRGAIAESVFHDVPIRPASFRAVSLHKLEHRVLSRLRTRRDLQLVQLHHPGLGRLGLAPAEITATDPSEYPRTRRWAQAFHDYGSHDGLVWISRLHNIDKAYTFFGDRVAPADLSPEGDPVPLSTAPGLDLVYELAEESGITIVHP